MNDFVDYTIRKARKIHLCALCCSEIEKGQLYRAVKFHSQCEFGEDKQCLDCADIVDWYCAVTGEREYAYEDILDYIRENYCDFCIDRKTCFVTDADVTKCTKVINMIRKQG